MENFLANLEDAFSFTKEQKSIFHALLPQKISKLFAIPIKKNSENTPVLPTNHSLLLLSGKDMIQNSSSQYSEKNYTIFQKIKKEHR